MRRTYFSSFSIFYEKINKIFVFNTNIKKHLYLHSIKWTLYLKYYDDI